MINTSRQNEDEKMRIWLSEIFQIKSFFGLFEFLKRQVKTKSLGKEGKQKKSEFMANSFPHLFSRDRRPTPNLRSVVSVLQVWETALSAGRS